jgi:tRNA(Ile)-lysidine synthase
MDILSEFRRILFSEASVSPDAAVVAGVSGGVDSMVMLHLLRMCGLRINVLHVNYHKRGASSNADEDLVRKACAEAGLQMEVIHWDNSNEVGGNFQDIARQFRRDQYQRVMHETGSEAILLGHNQDDMYETLVMRVLRGAAPSNWDALPAVDMPYVRPLISTSRAEIERFAHKSGIVWREDESNQTSTFARNFLRNELMPDIDRLYPGWRTNIDKIRMYGDVYRLALDQLLHPFGDASKLPVDWLRSLEPSLCSALIHRVHERKGLPVRQALPEAVLELLNSQPGRMVELDGMVAWHRDHDAITLDVTTHDAVDTVRFESVDVLSRTLEFDYGHIDQHVRVDTQATFALNAEPGSYELRSPLPGDKLRIEGGSKSVFDLLNEWGVPRRLKPRAYVLTLEGSVAAVIFSHPGFQTRWRIDPSHDCDGGKCIHFLIHH